MGHVEIQIRFRLSKIVFSQNGSSPSQKYLGLPIFFWHATLGVTIKHWLTLKYKIFYHDRSAKISNVWATVSAKYTLRTRFINLSVSNLLDYRAIVRADKIKWLEASTTTYMCESHVAMFCLHVARYSPWLVFLLHSNELNMSAIIF